MTVSVITDSAAALPSSLAGDVGVTVVPLRLTIGGVAYRDGDLGLEEVVRRFGEGVTTSGPTPGDVLEAIEGHGSDDGTLVLTVASALSGTYEAARAAVRHAEREVRVLDTAAAVGSQALVVLAAAERAREGGTLDEVEAAARHAAERVRLVARIASLRYLVTSGHVPGAAAWAARSLGLHPILELRRGKVRPHRPARSEEAAFGRILRSWRASRTPGARAHVVALHALAADRARDLLNAVRAEVEPATALVGPFSAVLVAHTGPDLLGLAWWWEERAGQPAGP